MSSLIARALVIQREEKMIEEVCSVEMPTNILPLCTWEEEFKIRIK